MNREVEELSMRVVKLEAHNQELKKILEAERCEADCYIDSMKKEIEEIKAENQKLRDRLIKEQQEVLKLRLGLSNYQVIR